MRERSCRCGRSDPAACYMCRTLADIDARRRKRAASRGFRMTICGRVSYVKCGDCEHYPCRCPQVDDWDLTLSGVA